MSDQDRERFKAQLQTRKLELEKALKRFDESEAAYAIVAAGGADVMADLMDLQQDRDRVKAMIAEIAKQSAALK